MAYIEVDVDLYDFDDDDIITEVMRRVKHRHNGKQFKKELLSELNINALSEQDASVTIRDEQYLEVFEQLKQKFSVSELEKLLI